MKLTVFLLLLAAVCQAAEERTQRSKQKEDSNTEKRALAEGNAAVKRAPVIPTALPSVTPGIEYADSNQLQNEKSPQQQVYATPLPQLFKISDLLTDQGPHFQSAIANHLFAPISIYQTRIPAYEVSAPVPSRLAYTEKLTLQPQQAQQYTPQVFKHSQKQDNLIRVSYPQQFGQYQQINQYQQLHAPQIQPVQYHQQQPQLFQVQNYQPLPQNLVYNPHSPQFQGPAQFSPQPLAYVQQQLPANLQPGIVYARQEERDQKPVQKESQTTQPQPTEQNSQATTQQKYNTQKQGAVSYASFSVGPQASQSQQTQPTQDYQAQPQQTQQTQHYQAQPQVTQYQPQPQIQIQYQTQPQPQQNYQVQLQQTQAQQRQKQVQNDHHYQIQRQPLPQFAQRAQVIQLYPAQQQQIHQQIQVKSEPAPENCINVASKPILSPSGKEQSVYFRDGPIVYHHQPYQGQQVVIPNQFASQQLLAAPTFAPVQYFGKYAQELFRNYQQ